ncbi:MAG: hypothetical protein WCX82_00190 [archaeon]
MKNEKTKLIIWAVVALVIGVIIGLLLTNVVSGNTTKVMNTKFNKNPFNDTVGACCKNTLNQYTSIESASCCVVIGRQGYDPETPLNELGSVLPPGFNYLWDDPIFDHPL